MIGVFLDSYDGDIVSLRITLVLRMKPMLVFPVLHLNIWTGGSLDVAKRKLPK